MSIDIYKVKQVAIKLKTRVDWQLLQQQKRTLDYVSGKLLDGKTFDLDTLSMEQKEDLIGILGFLDFIRDSVVDVGLVDENIVFSELHDELSKQD